MNLLGRLSKLLVPAPCHLCGSAVVSGQHLCRACARDLRSERHRCPLCALPVPQAGATCAACLKQKPPFDATVAGLDFNAPTRQLIHRFKYAADLTVLEDLTLPLWQQICQDADLPDALIPVPIHPSRRRGRGFNQARLIADLLGRRLCLPVLDGRVIRLQQSHGPQSRQSARMRRRFIKGAFAVKGDLPRRVAIVDDVMTTGSTVASLAKVLKQAGVVEVRVWVLARTPEPGAS